MQKTIIFGGGCFWCTEALFQRVTGVTKVVSGYAGGHDNNPNYQSVCGGTTGHAEVIEVTYDPAIISLSDLCAIFFATHNPTTKDQQGADKGSQYRSIILYTDDAEKPVIEEAINGAQKDQKNPILTEVAKLEKFYPAEDYHQNYYNNNPDQPYCAVLIAPKLEKFLKSKNI